MILPSERKQVQCVLLGFGGKKDLREILLYVGFESASSRFRISMVLYELYGADMFTIPHDWIGYIPIFYVIVMILILLLQDELK